MTVSIPINVTKKTLSETHEAIFEVERAGSFRVHVECEGMQNVADAKGDGSNEEEWKGVIAYNPKGYTWAVDSYDGSVLSNIQQSTRITRGHQDSRINNDALSEQTIEIDWTCSFDLTTTQRSRFGLFFPDIQLDQHYNFVVSYGGYSWKTMEYGTVSISIDEVSKTTKRSARESSRGGTPRDVITKTRQLCRQAEPEEIAGPAGGQKGPGSSERSDRVGNQPGAEPYFRIVPGSSSLGVGPKPHRR